MTFFAMSQMSSVLQCWDPVEGGGGGGGGGGRGGRGRGGGGAAAAGGVGAVEPPSSSLKGGLGRGLKADLRPRFSLEAVFWEIARVGPEMRNVRTASFVPNGTF